MKRRCWRILGLILGLGLATTVYHWVVDHPQVRCESCGHKQRVSRADVKSAMSHVDDEYWVEIGTYISCQKCNAQMASPWQARQHPPPPPEVGHKPPTGY